MDNQLSRKQSNTYLDEILCAQKQGEAKGITSICSSHPYVIRQALRMSDSYGIPALIESTCNQVNQMGGYTGMTPVKFVEFLKSIADQNHFKFENIILGGDHLGPHVWQHEPAPSAMDKSKVMVRDYVQAGYTKIHLDCSMRLADDPSAALDSITATKRTAELATVAEEYSDGDLRYIIGTEVPIPGGSTVKQQDRTVSQAKVVEETIDLTRKVFCNAGLESAWHRVIAIVVQPGVEYGDDFVIPYKPEAVQELSNFIENQPLIYEVHSTDYQTSEALQNLVRDHFAILKVGPALTYTFREAVFVLDQIEKELIPPELRSNLVETMDRVMSIHHDHWQDYYHGTIAEIAFKRRYSLSDRMRYYWNYPEVQCAYDQLVKNMRRIEIPFSIMSEVMPADKLRLFDPRRTYTFKNIIESYIFQVLSEYSTACGFGLR